MSIYSDPPPLRAFSQDKPSLLVCWWATIFCALMIVLRIAGRFIRTERLFSEDKFAAVALIPLFLRMGCVHFILINGTNNTDFTGVTLTPDELRKRSIASGLVLLSRILYAATLWILKGTVLEFLKRITDLTWQRSQQYTLIAIRCTLGLTFIAVIISDLAECHPFKHYWQVLPDPGGQCRQGYVQLITMATCNILTDLMLVIFPIPIIIQSNMRFRRKLQLLTLFSLSLSVVAVTLYRVPHIINAHGRQQYRSLLASVELIFATASANALVLGSFVRDRGVKKQKPRRSSTAAESFERAAPNRRPTIHRQWGSDEDLVRDVGLAVEPELREQPDSPSSDLYAPIQPMSSVGHDRQRWEQHQQEDSAQDSAPESAQESAQASQDLLIYRTESQHESRKVSLFDVGGLLEDAAGTSSGSYRRGSSFTSSSMDANASQSVPQPSRKASTNGVRRGSTALLQDLGGLLGPMNSKSSARSKHKPGTELQPIPQSHQEHHASRSEGSDLVLMDAGGLLR
ncbi:integral membrane [Trichoderma arundinaceum]|uniref:Integral membrane n=1 Tax=Trichoderma arundinaceum TaxID=490622 RepID=A0A395NP48_TRIAR|nr:integral membrane [Trichoderma arundinaceum]